MTKPITPQEAITKVEQTIPDYVFDAFNVLIAKNRKHVNQSDVIDEITRLSNWSVSRSQIFENKWLDIEDIYEKYGWNVTYNKPAYYEDYEAYFVFTPK